MNAANNSATAIDSTKNAFKHILNERRSVRGFTNEAASDELLREIFTDAQHAPSNCNTQPWLVHVASGSMCERLRTAITESMLQGKMSFDFPYDASQYTDIYKERQYDAAKQLYDAMGIKREDKVERQKAFMRNFNFFSAPHVAFLFMKEGFGIREAADLGMYAQTLMLAISANGLASCPQTSLSFHADLIKEVLGIPDDNKLLFGISFGYEDKSDPVNNARVGRAPIEEVVSFHQ